MTAFLCDSCDRVFPSGAKGSTFLVKPDGFTAHLCSGACLRAYVNRQSVQKYPVRVDKLFWYSMGAICGIAALMIEMYLAH
jgi:hypothetical protein